MKLSFNTMMWIAGLALIYSVVLKPWLIDSPPTSKPQAAAAPEYVLAVPRNAGPDTDRKISIAFNLLMERCDGIRRYWPLFKKKSAEYKPVYNPDRTRDYGWKNEVLFELSLRDDDLPSELLRGNGHTLHFWTGGGRRPGVIAGGKSWAKMMCGITDGLDDGADRWIAFDKLAVLGD